MVSTTRLSLAAGGVTLGLDDYLVRSPLGGAAVPNATDEQIEAILWKLHDAARTQTFDDLLISQKLVDARNPIIWFHIYRGPKCADEKYTTDALPCGPSYHAAGDYTLGSFSNKNRDDGILLHADGHQTELWNPDAPPTS